MPTTSKSAKGALALTFLGTRGEIAIRSRQHRRHSSLLVERAGARIMIDCGTDWLGSANRIAPTAIVLTHAHADHAAGLAAGAPCPVYATKETFNLIRHFPILQKRALPLRKAVVIDGVRLTAIPVAHSIRAPAVGYRVSVDGRCFFYVPDVAMLDEPRRSLRGVDLYIGDGATLMRTMVRMRNGHLIGHAPIAAQLSWCKRAGIHRAVFTHCGSAIVRADHRRLSATLLKLGEQNGIDASIARDGDRLRFPA